ncbi:MAG: hypothetical protein H7Z18_00020 [Methylophilaceae bacterium]|nr:hypothetical protein [Methylophilaceae bacterium]
MNTPIATRFPDVSCSRAQEIKYSWSEFFEKLEKVKDTLSKTSSPMIKLAKFGDDATTQGSLKHDANLVELLGIEGDYDNEVMFIDEACKLLEAHGIRAILHTSWTCTVDKPRWRVLAPLSKSMPKESHYGLVARLNGALGGVLAGESFTLAQGYFIGKNPDQPYTCIPTFGDPYGGKCIDQLEHLDLIALGKHEVRKAFSSTISSNPFEPKNWLTELLAGEDVNGNALRLVGRMVAKGHDEQTIYDTFEGWKDELINARGEERVADLFGGELDRMIKGARDKGFAPTSVSDLEKLIDDGIEPDVLILQIAEARLSNIIEENLLKKIKDKFSISLKALRADLNRHKQANEAGNDQLAYANRIIQEFGSLNILYAQLSFWKWDPTGLWRQIDDRELKVIAHEIIRSTGGQVSRNLVDGVIDLIKTEVHVNDTGLFNQQVGTFVNTKNCTLVLEDCEWKPRPPRREDYITVQLPIAYDPEAKCPRFLQFMDEIFDGDTDKEAKISCVLQAIGYSLTTDTKYEKFILLIGSGANGKSVLLSVLESLVGSKLVSAVQPSQFDNRFQRAHLAGKLINIVTEIAEGAEIADAQLKAIVSGELTTAEHKLKPPFDFNPYATCWFGTNHMPHTRDFSEALFRRAIILKFNNKFNEESAKCDPDLKEKLKQELPGILNTALNAYALLGLIGGFTTPKESKEAAKEWRLESDQVAQFFEDKCMFQSHSLVESSEIYMKYKSWANSAGINRIMGRKGFTDRLVRLGATLVRGTGGKRMIAGVSMQITVYDVDSIV